MSNAALILLDLQNEMVDPNGKIGAHGLAQAVADGHVLENAARALRIARAARLSVAHVRLGFREDYADALSVAARIATLKKNGAAILGAWGTEFPVALAPAPGELVVTKQCVNAFFNTPLLNWLLQKGVKRLYLGGVATNLAVEGAVRAADDAGFEPIVLRDCCAAPNPEWHAFSLDKIIPVFGAVSDVNGMEQACQAAA